MAINRIPLGLAMDRSKQRDAQEKTDGSADQPGGIIG
jgi:hypothetical protein